MEATGLSDGGPIGALVASGATESRGTSGPVKRRQPKGFDLTARPAPRPVSRPEVEPRAPVLRKSFLELYCESFGVRRENFARSLFFGCVKGWAMPVVAFQYCFSRNALEHDFRLIGEVAEATTYREFMGALENFTFRNRESGFLREVMRMRMSAKLLMKVGSKLLRHTDRQMLEDEKDAYAGLKPGGLPQRVSRRSSRRF